MKKISLILALVLMLTFVSGCKETENVELNNESIEETDLNNGDKFFPDNEIYTPELFVEMADTYSGILEGSSQQAYVFDLRNKEAYDKEHICGAINIQPELVVFEDLIDTIPSDWSVYVIANNDSEAEKFVSKLKEKDELLFVYYIEGGYEALSEVDGIEKYITSNPGTFTDFSRKKAEAEFQKNTEEKLPSNMVISA